MLTVFHYLIQILSCNLLVHVYSTPNFITEICISILMGIVHCLLIAEINNAIRELNVPPLKLVPKQSVADATSRRSVYKGVVRNHPDLGVDVVFKESNLLKSDWDTTTKINKILSTSLSEYIRRDLRRIKDHFSSDNGKDEKPIGPKYQSSMEKLYQYLFSDPAVHEVVENLEKFNTSEVLS